MDSRNIPKILCRTAANSGTRIRFPARPNLVRQHRAFGGHLGTSVSLHSDLEPASFDCIDRLPRCVYCDRRLRLHRGIARLAGDLSETHLAFPPGRPRRPFEALDLAPVVLTGSSLLGFAFLGALASVRFAVIVTALFGGNAVFRGLLKTPTRSGREILTKLEGYREFLSRAEADRLNGENEPGYTPDVLENCTAYAVALDAEHGWGEEFVENVLEMVQFDLAFYGGTAAPSGTKPRHLREFDVLSDDVIQLHIPQTPSRLESGS